MKCPKCDKEMKTVIFADGYSAQEFYVCDECEIKIEKK